MLQLVLIRILIRGPKNLQIQLDPDLKHCSKAINLFAPVFYDIMSKENVHF